MIIKKVHNKFALSTCKLQTANCKLIAICLTLILTSTSTFSQGVISELNTSSAVKRFIAKDGFRIPQVAALPTNPNLLNYTTPDASGALIYCTCAADTTKRGIWYWQVNQWVKFTPSADASILSYTLDSTGQAQGRWVFSGPNQKLSSSPYFLFDSANRKVTIGSTNVSIGGPSYRFYVNGKGHIGNLTTEGNTITPGKPPTGTGATYPIGWNPTTLELEKYTQWPDSITSYTKNASLDSNILTFSSGRRIAVVDNAGAGVTPAALTKTDDTNVTLTLSGTPSTALLQSVGIAAGWTGNLGIARGGTGAGTANAALNNLLPSQSGASGKVLQSNGTDASWQTPSGGSSASGSTGDVQFRRADGSFSSRPQFNYDSTNQTLRLIRSNETQPQLILGANGSSSSQFEYASGVTSWRTTYGDIKINVNGTVANNFEASANRLFLNNRGTGSTDFGFKIEGRRITVPTTVGDAVTLGTMSAPGGLLDVSISVQAAGFEVTKRYIITSNYDITAGAWQTLLPIANTGVYSGQDFDLEISQTTITLSLRIRRTSGTTAGTANVNIVSQGGANNFNWCTSGCTSAVSAPTNIYKLTYLTQVNNTVGVGYLTPAATLAVNGDVLINTNTAVSSSQLTVTSTTKGFLPPRMTTSQRNAISSPADGLIIFCTDCTATDGSTGVTQTYSSAAWRNHY